MTRLQRSGDICPHLRKGAISPGHVCDAIGLSASGQRVRINSEETLASARCDIAPRGDDGRGRSTTMLNLDKLSGWLLITSPTKPPPAIVRHDEVEVFGAPILVAVTEECAFFSPRHVAEAIGLNWSRQRIKIRDDESLSSREQEIHTRGKEGMMRTFEDPSDMQRIVIRHDIVTDSPSANIRLSALVSSFMKPEAPAPPTRRHRGTTSHQKG